jgi:hypothetical protein
MALDVQLTSNRVEVLALATFFFVPNSFLASADQCSLLTRFSLQLSAPPTNLSVCELQLLLHTNVETPLAFKDRAINLENLG